MTRWVFVRHAPSVANAEGWLAGWKDAPLAPGAREAALRAAPRLVGIPFERAFCSDLRRARDTAAALVGDRLPLVAVPALRERRLGDWEGQSKRALREDGRFDDLLTWALRPPGGESHHDIARRMLAWLAGVPDGGPTLVVAHGGILRATLGVLDGMPQAEIGRWNVRNLEILERRVGQGTWADLSRTLSSDEGPTRTHR